MEQIEIPGHGQVFNGPKYVQFADFNVVQPDIVVIMNSNRIAAPTKIKGVPDWVIEIVSPLNSRSRPAAKETTLRAKRSARILDRRYR